MKGDITTLDFMVSCFSVSTGLLGDVVVIMHSTTSTCPQVGAKCYPHLVSVIDFLVSGQPLAKVYDWGSLEGLSYHSRPYLPFSAHYIPIILPSSRPFEFSDPRRACSSLHGKKGLKAHGGDCWQNIRA
jgi:hypothetical protein